MQTNLFRDVSVGLETEQCSRGFFDKKLKYRLRSKSSNGRSELGLNLFSKHSGLKFFAVVLVLLVAASLVYVFATSPNSSFHGVGVLKSADAFAAVGDTVTYMIRVYNPSDFDLSHINVTDPLLQFNATIPFLAAGNETGVTYTLPRVVLESDPNPLVNTVSVEAVDSEGVYSTASTQAKTTIIARLVEIEKSGPEFAHECDSIKYMIKVTNVAGFAIANVTVKDEMLGFGWMGDLAAGEVNVFNLTVVVPKDAPDPLTNTAMVDAKVNQTTVHDEATWTVDILHPKIDVEKTVWPAEVFEEGNVTYKIVVTNTGDSTLYNLTLVDSLYGPAPNELIPESLLPAHSFTWIFNASVHGYTINKAKATGVDALGKKVWDWDKAVVKVKPEFHPRSMGYWKNHPEAWPVNEIEVGNVTYSKEEALEILMEANAKDATRMLAAQLISAKLNRLAGASAYFYFSDEWVNIDEVISEANAFLTTYPLGSNPEGDNRSFALQLKNVLDAYNNNGECEDDFEHEDD